jgi:hypothetical protein
MQANESRNVEGRGAPILQYGMAAAPSADSKPSTSDPSHTRISVKTALSTQLPLIRGACLLSFGLVLVAFVAKVLDLSDGALLAIVFLCPLLAYLILTGQLTEFAAGGVSAKFREAGRKPLNASVQRIVVEETQTVEKLGAEEFARIGALEREAPVVLTLVLGPHGGHYRPDALRQYLTLLSGFPRFKFVVLLDERGRAVAYLPAGSVTVMSETNATFKPLLDAVNSGHLPGVAALRTDFLGVETTVEDALQRLTELRVEAMLVRDTSGRLAGTVEREDVLARFLLDITRS